MKSRPPQHISSGALIALAVLLLAGLSFGLFSALQSSNVRTGAGPTTILTATPVGFFQTVLPPETPSTKPTPLMVIMTANPTPIYGPGPTRPPFPTPNWPTIAPQPTVPTPVWTPIPPIVTGWMTFTGKSGFSFAFPAGWYVNENIGRHMPENALALTISLVNYNPANYSPKIAVIPGAMTIQIFDLARGHIPSGGTPLAVGLQNLSGQQFIYGRDDPRIEPQFRVFEQRTTIYFTANKQQWGIMSTIYPPRDNIEKYNAIFNQILRSLHYENQ